MTRRNWVALDNASNIFLAARSDIDSKVFRMSAEMDHEVDPGVLQQALDLTFDRYPLYHAVLRRGVFWYYLQDSGLRPRVQSETDYPCAPIYWPDRRTLLFRVLYRSRRVMLEIFHALSDGTGALWFLTDLVDAYCRLLGSDAGRPRPAPGPEPERARALTTDSFARYFRRRQRPKVSGRSSGDGEFRRAAAPAALSVEGPGSQGRLLRHRRHLFDRRIYRVRGTRTPDNRPRVVELSMDAGPVLALARSHGAAVTIYLTAVFLKAVRLSSPGVGRATTLTASVPVNLRQFFPSTSARNFFATVRIEHTFGRGEDDIGEICHDLADQFSSRVTPEALETKLRRLIRMEQNVPVRIMPSPLKNLTLRLAAWTSNRGLTVAISNLGLVRLPEPAESRVARMMFHTAAVRPQFCAMTHAGTLTVSFTSPFVQTGHVREFARLLTGQGIGVTVASSRVTEAELDAVDTCRRGTSPRGQHREHR